MNKRTTPHGMVDLSKLISHGCKSVTYPHTHTHTHTHTKIKIKNKISHTSKPTVTVAFSIFLFTFVLSLCPTDKAATTKEKRETT